MHGLYFPLLARMEMDFGKIERRWVRAIKAEIGLIRILGIEAIFLNGFLDLISFLFVHRVQEKPMLLRAF